MNFRCPSHIKSNQFIYKTHLNGQCLKPTRMHNATGDYLSQRRSQQQEHSGERWPLGRASSRQDMMYNFCIWNQVVVCSTCTLIGPYHQNPSDLIVFPSWHAFYMCNTFDPEIFVSFYFFSFVSVTCRKPHHLFPLPFSCCILMGSHGHFTRGLARKCTEHKHLIWSHTAPQDKFRIMWGVQCRSESSLIVRETWTLFRYNLQKDEEAGGGRGQNQAWDEYKLQGEKQERVGSLLRSDDCYSEEEDTFGHFWCAFYWEYCCIETKPPIQMEVGEDEGAFVLFQGNLEKRVMSPPERKTMWVWLAYVSGRSLALPLCCLSSSVPPTILSLSSSLHCRKKPLCREDHCREEHAIWWPNIIHRINLLHINIL